MSRIRPSYPLYKFKYCPPTQLIIITLSKLTEYVVLKLQHMEVIKQHFLFFLFLIIIQLVDRNTMLLLYKLHLQRFFTRIAQQILKQQLFNPFHELMILERIVQQIIITYQLADLFADVSYYLFDMNRYTTSIQQSMNVPTRSVVIDTNIIGNYLYMQKFTRSAQSILTQQQVLLQFYTVSLKIFLHSIIMKQNLTRVRVPGEYQ